MRSSRPEVFCKRGVLRNFAKFTGKHLCQILSFNNLNGTQGKLCFTQFSTRMAAWLLLTFFIRLHNQLSSIRFITRIKEYRCVKNVIHQIDSKNKWLLLSASFTAKSGLFFCLNTGKHFFVEVSFGRQQTEHRFF